MATYAAPSGTTNFTGSLNLIDSTSLLNNETTASTYLTTSFVSSSAFTPGAITIDGIGVKVSIRSTSPTGTITIQLAQAGVAVTGTVVTCNVSDLPAQGNGSLSSGSFSQGYWAFFKFASPVTLLAATAYTVQGKTTTGTQVALWGSSSSNWSRYLRTTSTGTMAAGDTLFIVGEITGAGSTSRNVITHNNTATTQFNSVEVGNGGDWTWGNSASTAYYIACTDRILIRNGGTLTIPSMPSTSSATISFPAAAGAAGSYFHWGYGSVIRITGATKTAWAYLNADASVGATSITTDVSTGWSSGEEIVVASTSQTAGQYERLTMTGSASGTSVPVPALTYAHGGVSPIVAEVINLTRNVNIVGNSTTNTVYVVVHSLDYQINYVGFQYIGSSTTYKTGVLIASTGTVGNTISYCSFKDANSGASIINTNGSQSVDNVTFVGNVFFLAGAYAVFFVTNIKSANVSATNNFVINSGQVYVVDGYSTFNGLTVSSALTSPVLFQTTLRTALAFTNCNFHSNASSPNVTLLYGPARTKVILMSNVTSWRNTIGLVFSSVRDCVIDSITLFGNSQQNFYNNGAMENVNITNASIQSGTTLTCPVGVYLSSGSGKNVFFDNCNIGTVTTHATCDIQSTASLSFGGSVFRNCNFGSPTLITGANLIGQSAFVGIQNLNTTANSNRVYQANGTLTADTTIYDTSPVSQRAAPSTASYKTNCGSFIIPVLSGNTFTVSVKVRTSNTGSGDAATYNGNAPRLILKSNPAVGSTYNSDIVAATAVSSPGNWQTLSYTLPVAVTSSGALEFYIDCDGTTGFINWDTVTVQ